MMDKVNKLVLKVILVLLCIVVSCQITFAEVNTVKIYLDSIIPEEINHVGNEWHFTITINEKKIEKEINLLKDNREIYKFQEEMYQTKINKPDQVVHITLCVIDDDPVHDDKSTKKKDVLLHTIGESHTKIVEINVKVYEKHGNFRGNSARWKFNFVFHYAFEEENDM